MNKSTYQKVPVWKFLMCGVLSLALCVGFCPFNWGSAFAETVVSTEGTSTDQGDLYEGKNKNLSTSSDLLALDAKEPPQLDTMPDDVYGVDAEEIGKDEENTNTPFLLSEHNELFLGVTNSKASSSTISRAYKFNNLTMDITKGNVDNPDDEIWVDGVNKGHDTSATELNSDKLLAYNTLQFAQGVGFDANGTGRKQYVAQVGLNYGYIRVFVQKATDGSDSKAYDFNFEASWMTNLNSLSVMDNYFAITAGDYDGDGKESVVVYICGDDNNIKLIEIGKGTDGNWVALKNITTIAKISDLTTFKTYTSNNDVKYRPIVSLASGDFDGDNIDELAYSVGFLNTSNSAANGYTNYSCSSFENFATKVGVFDITKGAWKQSGSTWMYDEIKTRNYRVSQDGSTAVYSVPIMYGGAIAAGDTDNDGIDEIIAAGYTSVNCDKLKTTEMCNGTYVSGKLTKVDKVCDFSPDKRIAAVVKYNGKTYSRSNLQTIDITAYEQYTHSLFVDQRFVMPQVAIECAKTNGANNPEDVFIGGTVYDFSSGKPAAKYTPAIMKEKLRTLTGCGGFSDFNWSDCNWVKDVTAGNFDQNEAGREQFVYTIWGKHYDDEAYSANIGIIGGAGFPDEFDEDGNVTEYVANERYASNIPTDGALWKNYPIDGSNAGATQLFVQATSTTAISGYSTVTAVPIAVDTDSDGKLARFRTKGYVYTDPQVLAVLEAGPYFSEIDDDDGYSDPNETSYSITTGYSNGTSRSDNVSFECGFASEASGPGIQVSCEMGCAMDWSNSYEKEYSTESTVTFTAQEQDVVAMSRVPQLVYTYDIYNAETDKWIENGYTVKVPMPARYYLLSIDEYNSFVEEYNAIVESVGGDYILKEIEDGTDLPSAHLGVPDNYWHAWENAGDSGEALMGGYGSLGFASGNVSFEIVKSQSSSVITEQSVGFHYGLTVQAGGDFVVGEAWAGGYANVDYSTSTGSSRSTMNATSTSGKVQYVNAEKLINLDENPYTMKELKQYGFDWQLGSWTRQLQIPTAEEEAAMFFPFFTDPEKTTVVTEEVPFVGYITLDVQRPEGAVKISGPEKVKIVEGYEYATSPIFNAVGNPTPTITKVSGDDRITFNPVTKQLDIDEGLPLGTYKVTLKASNNVGRSATMDTYVVVNKCAERKEAEAFSKTLRNYDLFCASEDWRPDDDAEIQKARNIVTTWNELSASTRKYLTDADEAVVNAIKKLLNARDDGINVESTLDSIRQDVLWGFEDVNYEISYFAEETGEGSSYFNNSDFIDPNYTSPKQRMIDTFSALTNYDLQTLSKAFLTDGDLFFGDSGLRKLAIQNDKYLSRVYNCAIGKTQDDVWAERANEETDHAKEAAQKEEQYSQILNDVNNATTLNALESCYTKIKNALNEYWSMDDEARALMYAPYDEWEYTHNDLIWALFDAIDYYSSLKQGETDLIIDEGIAAQNALKVANTIGKLPKGDAITIWDEQKIADAVAAYNGLSDSQKALLGDEVKSWIETAQAKIKECQAAVIDISKKASKTTVKLGYSKKVYTGSALKPSVKVTVKGRNLEEGTDYTVTYSSNKYVGTAKVTIKGIYEYKGSVTKTFTIVPKATSLSKLYKAKKAIKVKWKKQTKQTTGYQVMVALNKKFTKGKKTVTVKGAKKTSVKVKKLKGGKKYFVKIRTYKKIGKKMYYSSWSKAKNVKTKK